MSDLVYTVWCPFGGVGGGALGFLRARQELSGHRGRFALLGGADSDPEACEDFARLTGIPEAQLDLFSRDDYRDFHGCEPPEGWAEATPADIRAAANGIRPDVVFTSPPCKAFSGLLPSKAANSPKYHALSRLTLRGIALILAAWPYDPPGLIILENVPRITTRGAELLKAAKALLRDRGYVFHEETHDLGETGGLSQHRRRYLLVARRPARIPAFLYQPPIRKVRSIGEAIGPLPMPDDPQGGAMHRLPRLSWLTWVRLALIPAGSDWRALQGIAPGSYAIRPERTPFNHIYRVTGFDQPLGTVTSSRDQGIADPRLGHEPRKGVFRVARWDVPATTVVGAASVRGSNGVAAVQDPRVREHGANYHGSPGLLGVIPWEGPSPAVTGSASVSSSNMPAAVQDPRLPGEHFPGHMAVTLWGDPARTVTGQGGGFSSNSGAAVADPRVSDRHSRRSGQLSVRGWKQPANTVTPEDTVGSGAPSVADPRLSCSPHSGAMRVVAWDEAAPTVTGAGDVHAQGAAAVADPRLPRDTENGAWVIIAEDGTWHRPLTTFELAVLQGFPTHMPDGSPLQLVGKSQARARERIGNAVPIPAAQAIAEQMLLSLMATTERQWLWSLYGTAVWVRQETLRRRVATYIAARRKAGALA